MGADALWHPARALLCSSGAPATGQERPPLPWQCPPKAPLPQLCLSQRLWVPSWGLGQGWHHEPPHSPSPAMTLLGGKTAAWLVTGGQLGCHGDGGGGGVTAHTRGMWGKEGLRGAEPHPWLLDQLCPGGLGSGDAAPLMFWGISWDLPSLTATGTLSHSNKDLYPGWWLLDKCLGTASLAAASQGQLMWALGAKNNGPPRLPQLVSVRRKRWCWW